MCQWFGDSMENYTLCKADLPEAYKYEYSFKNGEVFIFMGELTNMKGHCIVVRLSDGKLFFCFSIDNFVELKEDEL